jgi:hypothetical protein
MKPSVGHFSKFASRAKGISLPRSLRAAVAFDLQKRPQWFLFDLYAFWEFLCRIDSALYETISDEEYFSKNPVGRLIDEIEAHWPLKEESKAEIKREYECALRDIASGKLRPLTA